MFLAEWRAEGQQQYRMIGVCGGCWGAKWAGEADKDGWKAVYHTKNPGEAGRYLSTLCQ